MKARQSRQSGGAAATGQFHPEGGGLIHVETLAVRVPAAHGFSSLMAVLDAVKQSAGGHDSGLFVPGGEVRSGGEIWAHEGKLKR